MALSLGQNNDVSHGAVILRLVFSKLNFFFLFHPTIPPPPPRMDENSPNKKNKAIFHQVLVRFSENVILFPSHLFPKMKSYFRTIYVFKNSEVFKSHVIFFEDESIFQLIFFPTIHILFFIFLNVISSKM